MPPFPQPPQIDAPGTSSTDYNPYMVNAPGGGDQPQQSNWLEKLLPTIGGIGGGILGSIVGSPILGGAAGAGVGSTLGQKLENALTGSKTGLVTTGLENAAGGLLGGAVGKGISGVLGKAGSVADDVADSSFMKQAGGLVDRPTAQALRRGYGVNNFETASKIAPEITGQAGGEGALFHNGLINALDNAKTPVNLSKEATSWPSLLENHTINLTDKHVADISTNINNSFAQMAKNSGLDVNRVLMPGKTTGEITALEPGAMSKMSPRAVFDQGKLLTDKGFKIANSGPFDNFGHLTDPVKAAQADVYKSMGQMFKEKALGTDMGGSPLMLSTADKSMLKEGLSNVKSISPEAQMALSSLIDKSSSWQDINHAESLWAKVSQASKGLEATANKTIGGTPLDIASSIPRATLGMTQGPGGVIKAGIGSVLGGPTANRGETSLLSKFASTAQGKAAQNVLPLATRSLAIAGANLPNIAQSSAMDSANQSLTGNIGGGAGATMNGQETPFSQLVNLALHQASVDPDIASSVYPLLAALAPQLQKSAVAGAITPAFQQQFGAGGGATGAGGSGALNSLLSLLPFTSQGAARAQGGQITNLLGVSPNLAPSFLQTPGTAGTQMSALQAAIAASGGVPQ